MTAQHAVADMARYWNHPEVVALRNAAHAVNAGAKSGKARGAAMRAPLNAIRDKVAELKARDALQA
jgi:hypothetical protein